MTGVCLSPVDASFLRVESEAAHMHVGWSALLEPDRRRRRPTVAALRKHVAARLPLAPRARQRLVFPPLWLGEPRWVDDPAFDVATHVRAGSEPGEAISPGHFRALADAFLSRPLPRSRPLWEVLLVPRLADGRVGLVGKMHHAMVDGIAAVELALLLFDLEEPAGSAQEWVADAPPGPARLAAEALIGATVMPLRGAHRAARLLARPRAGVAGLAGTVQRAALAVREDVLPAAPPCALNVPIGPQRTLIGHRSDLALARRRADGATLNDVCLAAVAGALRALAIRRGEQPRALKAMVPVSVRAQNPRARSGNRISMAFVELPVDAATPTERLRLVHARTRRFKQTRRPEGLAALLDAAGRLPVALRGPVARTTAGARMYNLAVSNVPGPQAPVTVLGAKLTACYPVVPIADDHALSIGVFTYCDELFIGLYADPHAFPDVDRLPALLDHELHMLAGPRPARSLAAVPDPDGSPKGPPVPA